MNILYLTQEYPDLVPAHGGIGTIVKQLRSHLPAAIATRVAGVYRQAARTHSAGDCWVMAPGRIPRLRIPMDAARFNHLLCLRYRQFPFDLIEAPENGLAYISRRMPGRKIIRLHGGHQYLANERGSAPVPWKAWLERISFRKAHHICAVSHYVADRTRAALQLGDQPITIIPNPVDTTLFRPHPGIAEVAGRIVYAGSLVEQKGVFDLLEAFARISAAEPQTELHLYGRDTTDAASGESCRARLLAGAGERLASRIVFHGPVSQTELSRAFAAAQVLVFPSHAEAFLLVCLEGMAAGKAVVTSDIGPAREIIIPDETGLLCKPRQPESIAAAVLAVLRRPELRRKLAINARRHAEANFSLPAWIDRNVAFYEHCLAS